MGRNDLCHCGSGKKYKKYHGFNHNTQISPTKISQSFPIKGFSGTRQNTTIVPVYSNPRDPRNQIGPEGSPGEYQIIYKFNRPGFPLQSEYRLQACDFLKGDSHLGIIQPANPHAPSDNKFLKIRTGVDNEHYEFLVTPNDKGFLEKIEGKISASSFTDAHHKSNKGLFPTLSSWSLNLDIPLNPYQIDIFEVSTSSRRIIQMVPFRDTPFVGKTVEALIPDKLLEAGKLFYLEFWLVLLSVFDVPGYSQ